MKINKLLFSVITGFFVLWLPAALFAEAGVTSTTLTFGSVLALKGKAQDLGQGMQEGLQAAFAGQKVKGRSIQVLFENDFYEPPKAVEGTQKLIGQGIFLMIGNVGTPTAEKTLPILAQNNIPAVGFFTGAGLLRPAPGPVANYRASYIHETAALIDAALENGLTTTQICAYVQNDSYGMAGLTGVMLAMERAKASQEVLASYNQLIKMSGDDPERNNVGPVGVYQRNTPNVRPGYDSLKNWEKKSGKPCKLVVTVGTYDNIAHFARHASSMGEKWIVSAVSFTGANSLKNDLEKYQATLPVIMTQVVPLLDAKLPIVQEAKQKLGSAFGFVSLEGYIVGKMTLKILNEITGELTRANFVEQVKKSKFDLEGISIDFTKNGYQGSDLVVPSYLTPSGYVVMDANTWKQIIH
ncbi:ABC transporter substrate-binding protein [Deltaproteobacteria bacterium TL4]